MLIKDKAFINLFKGIAYIGTTRSNIYLRKDSKIKNKTGKQKSKTEKSKTLHKKKKGCCFIHMNI